MNRFDKRGQYPLHLARSAAAIRLIVEADPRLAASIFRKSSMLYLFHGHRQFLVQELRRLVPKEAPPPPSWPGVSEFLARAADAVVRQFV